MVVGVTFSFLVCAMGFAYAAGLLTAILVHGKFKHTTGG